MTPEFALDADGHTARVDVTVTSGHHELRSYDREVSSQFGYLELGRC